MRDLDSDWSFLWQKLTFRIFGYTLKHFDEDGWVHIRKYDYIYDNGGQDGP